MFGKTNPKVIGSLNRAVDAGASMEDINSILSRYGLSHLVEETAIQDMSADDMPDIPEMNIEEEAQVIAQLDREALKFENPKLVPDIKPPDISSDNVESDPLAKLDEIFNAALNDEYSSEQVDPFADMDSIFSSALDEENEYEPINTEPRAEYLEEEENPFSAIDNIFYDTINSPLPDDVGEEVEGTKVFGAAVDATVGSFQNAGALIAGGLGFDELEKRWNESAESNKERASDLAYKSMYGDEGFDQWKNITDGEWVEQTLAEIAPGSAPFLAGAGAGAVVGSAVPLVGTIIGAMIGGGGTLFVQTMGDAYYDGLGQGLSEEEAMDYSMAKSGATAVLNAISIPLGLAGIAAGGIKASLINAALRVGASEVSTETADTVVENVIDREYIDPETPLSRGIAKAVVGGLVFDATTIAAAGGKKAYQSKQEPLETDNELMDQVMDVINQTEAQVAAEGGDRLDQVTASSKALSELDLRDPHVRVKKLIDKETGEVIFEERQTQAEVEAEEEQLKLIEEDNKATQDQVDKSVVELGKIYQRQAAEAEAAEAAEAEETAAAEAEAAEADKPTPLDPLADIDMATLEVTIERTVNGETVEVTRTAERWRSELDKRRNVVDEVAKCLTS